MSEKSTSKKPCTIEQEARLSKFIQWLVDGHNSSSIRDLAKKEFNMAERTAYAYLADAKEKLKTTTPEQKSFYRNLAVERFTTIYQCSMANEKYQVAINAQVELNKVLGLYEPEKNEDLGVTITYTNIKAD